MPKRTPGTYLLLSLVLLPMFEQRSLKVDVCALGLLALTIFIVVALCTYHKTDPPSNLVFPPADTIHNACGRTGAFTAHFLFESLGLGAYYLAGSLTVLTLVLLTRREVDQPVLRTGGWAVSIVGLATLAALAVPNLSPGPVIGAGGYIGAMGRHVLEQHFARAGAYIFALTVFLAGLLLCTDYVLVKLAAVTTIFSGRRLAQLGRIRPAVVHRSKRPATDVDDGVDVDDADQDEDSWEHEEQDDDYEYDEDDDGYEYEYETEDDEEAEPAPRDIKVRTPAARSDAAEAPAERPPAVERGADVARKESVGNGPLTSGLKSALGIKNKRADQPHPQPRKSEREEIIEKLEAADHGVCDEVNYELPPLDLLLPADDVSYEEHEREVRRKAKVLEKTFRNFGLNVRVVEIETGPVIAQYEVQLEAGLRLSRITSLADDLAIALRVPSVRIVAPIPGKNTVGIEVPNENRQIVRLREVIEETNGRAKRMKIPIYLGKDVAGRPLIVDLATLPHLLIAGRTGTGKSVCLNSIIVSLLMCRGPDEVRMLMVDPKMVELSGYQKLPHLMHPVVTDMRKAEAILAWAVDKMEERYQLLARAGVRHVSVYNQLGDDELRDRICPRTEIEWEQIPRQLPFIVIIADEMADLMMTAGKDVEQHIIRLAQKSRAVGIHLILATQKPTVDVITGLIKSNLPARIAFQVASRTDSRVVLDEMGAEKLLGNGDMLFLSPGTSMLLRGQGTYLSDDEIVRVVDFVGTDDPQFAHELLELKTKDEKEAASAADFKNRDELYEAAVDIVVRERRGSVSLLQRALGIGYGRAARLIDFMAEDAIVGQYNGAQAREVLISLDEWEAMAGGNQSTGEPPPATAVSTRTSAAKSRRRVNKIRPRAESAGDTSLRTSKHKSVVHTIEEQDGNNEEYDDDELDPPFEDPEDEWDEQDEGELADEEYEDEDGEEGEFDEWDEDPEACEATDEDLEDYEDEDWDDDDQAYEDEDGYEYEDEDDEVDEDTEPEDGEWEDEEESEWEDDAEEEWVEDEEVEDEEYADK